MICVCGLTDLQHQQVIPALRAHVFRKTLHHTFFQSIDDFPFPVIAPVDEADFARGRRRRKRPDMSFNVGRTHQSSQKFRDKCVALVFLNHMAKRIETPTLKMNILKNTVSAWTDGTVLRDLSLEAIAVFEHPHLRGIEVFGGYFLFV